MTLSSPAKTNEDHLEILEKLFRDTVQFCGNEIDSEGLHKPQEKIEAVVNTPRPENV